MLKKNLFIFCTAVMAAVFISSCTYDKAELIIVPPISACDTITATFSADVQPIITSRCAVYECHDLSYSGGYAFFEYPDIKAAIDKIQQQVIVLKLMPKDSPLTETELNLIKCWIEAGAQNN